MAKRNYLALLAILLLAFALRVYRLDSQSLWYDEAVTAHVASQGRPSSTGPRPSS